MLYPNQARPLIFTYKMTSKDYNFDPNYFMKLTNIEEFGEEEGGFTRRNSELSFDVNEDDLLVICKGCSNN